MWYKKNVQNERKIRIYTHTQNIRIEKFHHEIILSQPLEVVWSCLFRPSEKGLECTELINRYRYTHVSRDKPEEAEIRLKNRPSIYIYIRGTRRRCAITTVLYIPPPFDITNPLVSAISTFSLACVPMTLDVSCTLCVFFSLSSPFYSFSPSNGPGDRF